MNTSSEQSTGTCIRTPENAQKRLLTWLRWSNVRRRDELEATKTNGDVGMQIWIEIGKEFNEMRSAADNIQ